MKPLRFTILLISILCSCRDRPVNTYENKMGVEPGHLAQIDTANYTQISFADTVKDFGTIKAGIPVILKYPFTNSGRTALFISSVQASCGCTVADFPKKALLPGEEGIITATFDSKNHPGFIRKTITVHSNTTNGMRHVLVLTGHVKDSI